MSSDFYENRVKLAQKSFHLTTNIYRQDVNSKNLKRIASAVLLSVVEDIGTKNHGVAVAWLTSTSPEYIACRANWCSHAGRDVDDFVKKALKLVAIAEAPARSPGFTPAERSRASMSSGA